MATSTIYDWLMGFTPKKWRLLPVVWLWTFTSSVVWLLGFTSSVVWLMGFPPTSGLVVGLYPFSGLINKFLPHQWFDIGFYPDNNLIQLQCYYPQWRLPSVCTAMLVHFPSYSSSFISFTCYKELCIHTFIHSCIYIIYTTSFLHDCISHPESFFCRILSVRSSLNLGVKRIACKISFVPFGIMCLLDQVNPLPISFVPLGPG